MTPGDRLVVTVDQPAAGGDMIARHEGRVLFVAGAIPGEVVEVHVDRVQRGTVWASVVRIVEASSDRVGDSADVACGGNVYAHIQYARQLELKRQIIRDGFGRLARLPIETPFDVAASSPHGYRMRARVHVRGGRVGFFRERTHDLCDIRGTRQLSDDACTVVEALERALREAPSARVTEIELSENVSGAERACHLDLGQGTDPSRLATATTVAGLRGISCAAGADARELVLWGEPRVSDAIDVTTADGTKPVHLSRHARSFFQGNRFLLNELIDHVGTRVPDGPVVDLYAGVGLFAVTRAARGGVTVTAVEGDRWAGADLRQNALPFPDAITVRRAPVESLPPTLAAKADATTVIVDPPRTGLSREAARLVVGWRAARLIYVSCDIATLARDARIMVDAGYALKDLKAFDLFPNTAHVEIVAVFDGEWGR